MGRQEKRIRPVLRDRDREAGRIPPVQVTGDSGSLELKGAGAHNRAAMVKIVLAAILVFNASMLWADDSPEGLLRRAGRYGEADVTLVGGIFQEAASEGIDAELLMPKLEEALAKKATADPLITALKNEVSRLLDARRCLLEIEGGERLLLDNASWQRTANLLAWGASEEEIKVIVSSIRHRSGDFQQASYLYVSLVHWGLHRNSALSLTSAVSESSIRAKDFPGILEILIQGRRLLLSPAELSRRMVEVLPRVRNLRQLKERILYE